MKKRFAWGTAALLLTLPVLVWSQDDTPQLAYIYATYFECDPATEARADEIIARTYKPHYDAAVESGDIQGWSWLAHFVGGKWRRVLVLNASDMDHLLDASGALGEILADTTPEAGRAFSETCPVHEDYIWEAAEGLSSTPTDAGAGAVGFSMYMQCDMAEEQRANEIFRDQIAPIYDRHVAEGELNGWAMLNHNVGGKFRRLLTLAADDHKAIMRARAAIIEEAQGGRSERALNQLNEICWSHEDYMWDVRVQNP